MALDELQGKEYLQRIGLIENTLSKLDKRVETIYNTIVGDERLDHAGIITRLKTVEKEVEKHKTLKNKLVGAFVAAGALWTVLWELVKNLLKLKT